MRAQAKTKAELSHELMLCRKRLAELESAESERRRMEETVRAKTLELDQYYSNSPDLLCVAGTDGRFCHLNPKWEKAFGYSLAELQAKRFLDFVHPDDLESTLKVLAALAEESKVLNFVNRYRRKDGCYRWVEWRAYLVENLIYAIARDITEHKQAQDALCRSEALYRSIAHNYANGAVYVFDRDLRYLVVDGQALQQIGWSREEFEGVLVADLDQETRELAESRYRRVLAGETLRCETHYRGRVFLSDYVPIRDHQGEVAMGLVVATDISEQKRVEEELRKSEARFRAIYEQAPLGIALLNSHTGQYLQVNPRYCEIVGRTQEELLKLDWQSITHPDDLSAGFENLNRLLEGACRLFKREKRYVRPDGTIVWTSLTAVPIWAPGEAAKFHIALVENITERKRAEKERESTWALLEAAVTQSPSGILIADAPNVTFRLANPAAYGILGETGQSLIGTDANDHSITWRTLRPDGSPYPAGERPLSRAVLKGEVTRNEEMIIRHESGEMRWVSVNAAPIMNSEGGIAAGVVVFHDLTERKLMETELLRSRDELELRVQERTAELKRLNDELRSLSSRLISIQEEERKRVANELHDSIGQTFAALKFGIEAVLVARDRGETAEAFALLEQFVPTIQRSIDETRAIYMGLRPTMLDSLGLLATIEWFCREFQCLYPHFQFTLKTQIEEEEIPEVLRTTIYRIVQEALNNVAKHSGAKQVQFSLTKQEGAIRLLIQDNGKGFQGDSVLSHSHGMSLGLASMRERAELTGGSLTIESTPGKGTVLQAFWPIPAKS